MGLCVSSECYCGAEISPFRPPRRRSDRCVSAPRGVEVSRDTMVGRWWGRLRLPSENAQVWLPRGRHRDRGSRSSTLESRMRRSERRGCDDRTHAVAFHSVELSRAMAARYGTA